VDLSGSVFGGATLMQGDSIKDSDVTVGGAMYQIRLQGSGEAGDGKFGGWLRADSMASIMQQGNLTGHPWETDNLRLFAIFGYAWWKPIDQFKLTIGGNPDGLIAKDGFVCWNFNQTATDSGIIEDLGHKFGAMRNAFYGGFAGNGALLEIKPLDMVSVNIAIPFITGAIIDDPTSPGNKIANYEAKNVFKAMVAQVDLNFDFGNIAFTYVGDSDGDGGDKGKFLAFYGGSFGDISLNVGLGYGFAKDSPFNIGLGLKYATGAFGVKFRTEMDIPTADGAAFPLVLGVVPYYAFNDNLSAFLSAGLDLSIPDSGDATVGWYVNPYLRVGAEWGPTFYFGVQIFSDGKKGKDSSDLDKTVVQFAVPVSIHVSF